MSKKLKLQKKLKAKKVKRVVSRLKRNLSTLLPRDFQILSKTQLSSKKNFFRLVKTRWQNTPRYQRTDLNKMRMHLSSLL